MYIFFQCVAEAVAENGLRGLAEFVPSGSAMYDIAESAWKKYRERCKDAQQRGEIQRMAQATFDQVKQAAQEAATKTAAKQPDLLPVLELYLTQIPAAIRQSLKRSDDPTGTTVPATFSLRSAEDVAKLLPPSLPRFRAGDELPGKPGWTLERQLGIGGFGEVWLARKKGYESLIGAVKFCRHLQTGDREMLHESKIIDRLLAQAAHANIVKLLDVHLESEAPWLMYEYVEGGELTDMIHQWAGLPLNQRQQKAIAALKELAATIAHFHRLVPAIVHRDLKPANILCDKQGRLRITDFGISGVAAKHMIKNETLGVTTRAGRLQFTHSGSYTPLYASPQQRNGADPDPRDDVHALGVIGYQMLTGQVCEGAGPDFAEDLKETGVNEDLIAILRQCISSKADRRFGNAKDVEKALEKISPHNNTDATAQPRSGDKPKDYPTSVAWFSQVAGRGMIFAAILSMTLAVFFIAFAFLVGFSEVLFGLSSWMALCSFPTLFAGLQLCRQKQSWLGFLGCLIAITGGSFFLWFLLTERNRLIHRSSEFPSYFGDWVFLSFIVGIGLQGPISVCCGIGGVVAMARAYLAQDES